MTRLRHGPRFAGSGLGRSQTIWQLHGLTQGSRQRGARYAMVREELLAKAKRGDVVALRNLTKLHLACQVGRVYSLRAKTRKPTKVKFSWDKEGT